MSAVAGSVAASGLQRSRFSVSRMRTLPVLGSVETERLRREQAERVGRAGEERGRADGHVGVDVVDEHARAAGGGRRDEAGARERRGGDVERGQARSSRRPRARSWRPTARSTGRATAAPSSGSRTGTPLFGPPTTAVTRERWNITRLPAEGRAVGAGVAVGHRVQVARARRQLADGGRRERRRPDARGRRADVGVDDRRSPRPRSAGRDARAAVGGAADLQRRRLPAPRTRAPTGRSPAG